MAKTRSVTKPDQPTQLDWTPPERRAKSAATYCHSELVGECNCDDLANALPEFKVALTNIPPGSEEFLNAGSSRPSPYLEVGTGSRSSRRTRPRHSRRRANLGRCATGGAGIGSSSTLLIGSSPPRCCRRMISGSKTAFGQICLLIEGFRDGLAFASKKEG